MVGNVVVLSEEETEEQGQEESTRILWALGRRIQADTAIGAVEREHSAALYIEAVVARIEAIEDWQMGWMARSVGQQE